MEKNIAGERKMKKNDSVKRLIILALGLIGLCVLTAFMRTTGSPIIIIILHGKHITVLM